MQIRIIRKESEYVNKNCINVMPFGEIGTVDYKRQLRGEGKELVNLGRLSRKLGGVTLVGGISDNVGVMKKSVFVFKDSSLVSICDMNKQEERFSSSFGYKIIEFSGKKIGVLVDRDIFCVSAISSLVNCGVSLIINLYEGLCGKKAEIASEFYSYVFGVDFLCVSQNEAFAFNAFGERKNFLMGEIEMQGECIYRECRRKIRGNYL